MDIGLIERVHDKDRITRIVRTMFDDVVEDGTDGDCFDLDVNSDCWLSIDDYRALFQIKAYNRTTLDIHCYIPKHNRINSKKYGKIALNWIKDNAPSIYQKVITTVPSIYRHIGIYVLGLGFKEEGRLTKAFTKDGERWDMVYYSIEICDI